MLTAWDGLSERQGGRKSNADQHVRGQRMIERVNEWCCDSGETAVSMGFTGHVQPSRCVAQQAAGVASWHHQAS